MKGSTCTYKSLCPDHPYQSEIDTWITNQGSSQAREAIYKLVHLTHVKSSTTDSTRMSALSGHYPRLTINACFFTAYEQTLSYSFNQSHILLLGGKLSSNMQHFSSIR